MAIQEKFPNIRPSLNLDFANTKTLDPRIAFSRASEGRYYDGKTVAKAEENLFLRSQEFDDAAWLKTNTTVTTNVTTAPDGTSTADFLLPNTNSGEHILAQSSPYSATTPDVMSCYMKAGGYNWGHLRANISGSWRSAYFDLQNGVVGSFTGFANATIQSVGNGWYRCVAFTNGRTIANFALGAANADGGLVFAGDGTSGIYIWGAQLEQRSSVTVYSPTTDQPIANYIPVLQTAAANVARFDHNPVTGESLGLLIEEQRTNLLNYSEQFNNAGWTKYHVTITANAVVAPDGTLTADKLVEGTTTDSWLLTNASGSSIQALGAITATATVYAKAESRSFVFGLLQSGGVFFGAYFDLVNGTATVSAATGQGSQYSVPSSYSITPVGNGWYRCAVTHTTATSWFGVRSMLINTSAGNQFNYTGDGYSGIYIWGAQLEVGAFPTSYIKTEASQVTRSADAASMTGTNFSSWYRQDEGTIYAESFVANAATNDRGILSLQQNSSVGVSIEFDAAANNIEIVTRNASSIGTSKPLIGSLSVSHKGAASLGNGGSMALSVDGGAVSTSVTTNYIFPVSMLIGKQDIQGGRGYLNGHIRKIAYYPKRLTNTQLQAITT